MSVCGCDAREGVDGAAMAAVAAAELMKADNNK